MESNTQKRKRIKKEGAEKIYENDKWLVVRPTTIEASRLYGSDTKWCVTMRGKTHLQVYLDEGCMYYIIDKKKENKLYNKVLFHLTWTGNYDIYNKNDDNHRLMKEKGIKESNENFLNLTLPSDIKHIIYKNWETHLTPYKLNKQKNFRLTTKGFLQERIHNYITRTDFNRVNIFTTLTYLVLLSPILIVKSLLKR
mgnify:FL=1